MAINYLYTQQSFANTSNHIFNCENFSVFAKLQTIQTCDFCKKWSLWCKRKQKKCWIAYCVKKLARFGVFCRWWKNSIYTNKIRGLYYLVVCCPPPYLERINKAGSYPPKRWRWRRRHHCQRLKNMTWRLEPSGNERYCEWMKRAWR